MKQELKFKVDNKGGYWWYMIIDSFEAFVFSSFSWLRNLNTGSFIGCDQVLGTPEVSVR